MRVLILEDDIEIAKTYKEQIMSFNKNFEVDVCDILPLFDDALYSDPGFEYFDKIIIDAMIDPPVGIDIEKYDRWLKKRGLDNPSTISERRGSSYIYGWDYYDRIITKHEKTKEHLDRFLIISGYAALIKKKFPEMDEQKILNKGDRDFVKKFREFILSK